MAEHVAFLDDDGVLRQVMGEVIPVFTQAVCLTFGSFVEFVSHAEAVLSCRVAILDINLGSGQPSGIDAYEWLRARKFAGKIVFLTGHALSNPLVARARQESGVEVYEKPIDMNVLEKIVFSALQGQGSAA